MCRFAFWRAGLDYEVRSVDTDHSYGDVLWSNGYKGGNFMLPVVVHAGKGVDVCRSLCLSM